MFFTASIQELQAPGQKFTPSRPICSRCDSKVWGHGHVGRFFNGIKGAILVKRWRCPYCRLIITCRPKLFWRRYQESIENIFNAMKNVIGTKYPQARFIGHFSHWFNWGCMLYARFIIETPPEDPHELLFVHNSIWNDALRAAIEAGGVLNEHHGIGLKLSRLVPELYGNSFDILKNLKKSLDPNGIMNPGKLGFGV